MKFFLFQAWLRIRRRRLNSQINEDGFVLPLVFGIGLFMLIVGATMIFRSQDDQTTAIAQRETSSGLAAAETGLTGSIIFSLQTVFFPNIHQMIASLPTVGRMVKLGKH